MGLDCRGALGPGDVRVDVFSTDLERIPDRVGMKGVDLQEGRVAARLAI